MARATFAALALCAKVAQSLEVLECSGPWTLLRSRLYAIANPDARHFAISVQEALSVVADFREELEPETDADVADCPLGSVALHIVEGLQLDREEVATLDSDFAILNAFGWRTLLRSGWPIFQLLLLLHKHLSGVAGCCHVCSGTEGYTRSLQMALQHQPSTGVGLTAKSLSFLMDERAASCPSLASAAILAIAWTRLPVYDVETEGLVMQAEQRTTLMDLVLADASHPLPLVAARLSAASQLSMHLPEPSVPEESPHEGCVVRFAQTPSGRCNFFATIRQGLEPWWSRGIYLEDQVRAFRPTTDQKTVLFRLIGDQLVQSLLHQQLSHPSHRDGPQPPQTEIEQILDKEPVIAVDNLLLLQALPRCCRRSAMLKLPRQALFKRLPKKSFMTSILGTHEAYTEEFRILHEHLQELDKSELELVAAQASIDLPKKQTKKQLILRLLNPQHLEAVKKVVVPEERPPEAIRPDLLRKVQLHAAKAANLRPKGAGRRPATRKNIDELKAGDCLSGRVVEISLLDGIRIDIGMAVDGLIPVRMEEDPELLERIVEAYPLGSTVQVQIEDVSQDLERRFPIICTFQRQVVDLPDWQIAGMALRPHEAGIHSRGRDEVELAQSDDWQKEAEALKGNTTKNSALKDVPHRQPPEVVISIGSGSLEAIQVPEQHRAGAPAKSKTAVRKAWQAFMNEEVTKLRLQLHCRQRLARELATIEAQLLQGNHPTVPVELLGMTLLPNSLGCLLPVPDGDCLKFQVEGEGPEKEQLAKFFACADAWHARAVQAAEEEEIRKLQYQNVQSDDSDEAMAHLEDLVSKMNLSQTDLQDDMKEEYLRGLA
eukprot:s3192_g9.t3